MKKHDRSGSGSYNESDWPYFKKLMFLKCNIEHRKMISTINEDEGCTDIWKMSTSNIENNKSALYKPTTSKRVTVPEHDTFAKKAKIHEKREFSSLMTNLEK